MSQIVDLALQRVKAAYSTVPPALEPTAWLYIATFVALVIPIGMLTGVLNFKIEKRPSKWLEVRRRRMRRSSCCYCCCDSCATAGGSAKAIELAWSHRRARSQSSSTG
jgi:hypothetical protein